MAAEDDAVAVQRRREPPLVEGYGLQLGIIGDEARTPRTVVEAPLQPQARLLPRADEAPGLELLQLACLRELL